MGLDAQLKARILGILQIETATVGLKPDAAPDRAIRWNLPPGERVTYPPSVIEAPDTVTAGQAFQVTVWTVGPSGCWAADGIDSQTSGRVVAMTPWDRHSGAEVCTMVLSYLAHVTTVRLEETGEWTLRVTGRRVRDGSPDDSVTAERTVFVRAAG